MIINKLILRNIGAYYGGHNEFDLSTTIDRNVILFGGKNGAGKTTLLESIRLVLFGTLAYGYMTDNEVYYNRIRMILNRTALLQGESTYQIIMNHTTVENFVPVEYILSRSWNVKNDKLKETFTVQRAGKYLDPRQVDNYQNKVREEIPPRLFELCLFDGEEISRIVSDGQIPHYLQEASKVLFNLDLFVNLEKDLQLYRSQLVEKEDASTEEKQKVEFELELERMQTKLYELVESKQTLLDEGTSLREKMSELKRSFDLHGGLIKEQRHALLTQSNEIENQRKENSDKIKGFITEQLPFLMVKDLLRSVDTQMEQEQLYESFEVVRTKIDRELIRQLAATQGGQTDSTDALIESLYQGIMSRLRPAQDLIIHRASFAQRSEIRELANKVDKIAPSDYHELFRVNTELLEQAQKLRKAVEENDRASDFNHILSDIENKSKQLEQNRLAAEQLDLEIADTSSKINVLHTELDKLGQKLHSSRKTENSFVIAERIMTVSQRFRDMQLRKKLDQVEQEARNMIKLLFRKKNYIHRIHIDNATFDLHLYSQDNEELVKERLSAGEKEMLMLAVIWSMFRVSNWRLPFVFDTLLGRLDQDHKKELIEQFIPKCGEQVLILSTDSEITPDQFSSIEPIVARCYTLEFDEQNNRANILRDQYFMMREAERVL